MIRVRQATQADAAGMDAVLTPILEAWGSARPRGEAFVRAHYVNDSNRLSCVVAEEAGEIIGFQSLKFAGEGNVYDVPVGWGVIGSYVKPGGHGGGVGRAMFAETRAEAITHGLTRIDATIGADNPQGLAYYSAMGFETYDEAPGVIRKVLRLDYPRKKPTIS